MTSLLTIDEFASAVRKGLGRAVLALDEPVPDAYHQVILTACQEDQRYDRQCEDRRTDYLMALLDRARIVDRFLESALAPLENECDTRTRSLRMQMLGQFARRGRDEAWTVLVGYASTGMEEAWDALELVGARGIAWLTAHVLPGLPSEERWRTVSWLDCDGLSPSTVAVLTEVQREQDAAREARPKPRSKMPKTFVGALKKVQRESRYTSVLRRLADVLTVEEVQLVAKLWLTESNPGRGASYADLFSECDFPFPIESLLDLVKSGKAPHDYEEVLSRISHPAARNHGLALLSRPEPNWRGYACLQSSFSAEDEPFLESALSSFTSLSADDLHALGYPLMEVAQRMESPELRFAMLRWVYENTPCSLCRSKPVEEMVKHGVLPDFYRRELEFDADSYSRELATGRAKPGD